jgi:hypothetical protein
VPLQELTPERGIVLVSAIALALFGGVLLLFLVPYVRGLVAGVQSGDWWTPFARRQDGRYGVLANSRFLASFRAPDPEARTRGGLMARWVVWTVVVVGLAAYPAWLVATILRAL